jgi:hypothetical protein
MWQSVPSTKPQTDEQSEKYFNFQIRGWTNFDPIDKTLAKVAEGIEQGGGFLTRIEVLSVENDIAAISDEEAEEFFANIIAAKRLVRNIHELPKKLIEEIRSALKAEEEVVPKKPVALSDSSAMSHGSRAKPWP